MYSKEGWACPPLFIHFWPFFRLQISGISIQRWFLWVYQDIKRVYLILCVPQPNTYIPMRRGACHPHGPSFIHVWHRRSTDKCHFDPKIAIRPVLFATQGRKGFYCFLFGVCVCVKPNQTISNHIRLSHWSLQIMFKSISFFRDFHVIR